MLSSCPGPVWAKLWVLFLFLSVTLLHAQDLTTDAQTDTPSSTARQVPVTLKAELKTTSKPTSARLLAAPTSTFPTTATFPSSTSRNDKSTVTAQGTTGALSTSNAAKTSSAIESTAAVSLYSTEDSTLFETTSVVPESAIDNSSEPVVTLVPITEGTPPSASLPSSSSTTVGPTTEGNTTEFTAATRVAFKSSTESSTESFTESSTESSTELTYLTPLESPSLCSSARPLLPQNPLTSPWSLGSTMPPVVIEGKDQSYLLWIIIAVLAFVFCVGLCLILCIRHRRRSQVKHFSSGQWSTKKKKKGAEDDAWAGPVNLGGAAGRDEGEGGEELTGGGGGEKPGHAENLVLSTFVAKETEREGPDGGVGEVNSREASKWEEDAPLLYIDEDALPEPAKRSGSAGEEGEKGSEKETEEKGGGKENGKITVGEMNGGATFCMTTAV